MTDTSKEAVDVTKASHKTLASEYMFGIQVAAYDEDIETSYGPVKRYCSHWSTPGNGAVNVRRLFAEEDVLTLLSERDALRAQLQAARDEALEEAAYQAQHACLVPPDGGSPTEEEIAVCDEAAKRIRVLKSTSVEGEG